MRREPTKSVSDGCASAAVSFWRRAVRAALPSRSAGSIGRRVAVLAGGMVLAAVFVQQSLASCCDDVMQVWQPPAPPLVHGGGHGDGYGYCHGSVRVTKVKPGQSLQSAICRVLPGGTVIVEPGTYTLSDGLSIKKPITIQGAVPPFVPFSRQQMDHSRTAAIYEDSGSKGGPTTDNVTKGSALTKHYTERSSAPDMQASVLKFADGGSSCLYVDLKKHADGMVRLRNLKIQSAGNGPRIRPCVDVNAPMFVMEAVWIDANGGVSAPSRHNAYRGISDDALIVRSGLAQIYGSLIEGGKVGVRLTGYYEKTPDADYISRYHTMARDYVCSTTPFVSYQYGGMPITCDGFSRRGGPGSTYIDGRHLMLDNHIGNNLVGLEIDGGASVFAARNRIANNLQIGISNLDGGGSFTGNHITDNGEGIAFILSTLDSSRRASPTWGAGPAPDSALEVQTSYATWPLNMPIVSGNFITSNNGAGVQVVTDLDWKYIDRQGRNRDNTLLPFRNSERYEIYQQVVSKIGTLWGNCILDNTGYAIEILGTKNRDPNGAMKGRTVFHGDRDPEGADLPRNFEYDNRSDKWLTRKVKKLTKKKFCDWNETGANTATVYPYTYR